MHNSRSMSVTTSSASSEESMTGKHAPSGSGPSHLPSVLPSTFVSTIGMMKDRATMAKNQFTPQLQQMRERTSKKFEQYQPSINKVRSTANAAASMGREKMQPALSRVREGSTQGWSMLKTKLASAAPVAAKVQTMGMHVVNDFLGETAIEVVMVDSPALESCRFLEQYKHGHQESPRIPRMLITAALTRTSSGGLKATSAPQSPSERCFSTPYILGHILLFCGSVETLGRVSLVNKACRSFLRSERRLWRFCVRYGEMPAHIRFSYWEHVANVKKLRQTSELDFETYLLMAKSKGECTELILTDVRRTYGRVAPHKRAMGDNKEVVYDTEQELINQLSDILHALSGRFPDVGYCQGMDYIAAHILDHVKKSSEAREAARLARKAAMHGIESPPTSPTRSSAQAATRIEVESAFWILVALFENYGLRQMFCPGLQKLQLHCFQCQRLFELAVPELSEHFENEKVMIEMFIVGWFQTLYLYLNVLPRETLDKMWDIFLFENNWKIMVRVALALLQLSEPHIVNKPIDEVMQFLNTFTAKSSELLAPEHLIPRALGIKVTNAMLSKLAKQHARRRKAASSTISR